MLEHIDFLGEGDFTIIGDRVRGVLDVLRKSDDRMGLAVSGYLENLKGHKNFIHGLSPWLQAKNKRAIYRKRGAEEIIESGYSTGCTDRALAFCALVREDGLAVRYIDTLEKDWLENFDPNHIRGHVFTEVRIGNSWARYDPIIGFIPGDTFRLGDREYVEIGTGLDFSQIYRREGDTYSKTPIAIDSLDKLRQIGREMSQSLTK